MLGRSAAALFFVGMAASPALALDHVTFATNWRAEAEHGGFYEALVDGTYAKYGLDVTIQQGGPQSNARLLLAAGRVDFDLGANMIQAFTGVEQDVPILAVAALFQKDPFILMSHPGQGLDRLEDSAQSDGFHRQGCARLRLSMAAFVLRIFGLARQTLYVQFSPLPRR